MATIMTDSENRTLNDKFMLRLPDGMRELIKASAEANGRSMNAEIIRRLGDSYGEESLREMEGAADAIERGRLEARLLKALMNRLMFELGNDFSTDAMQAIIEKLKVPSQE